MIKDLAYTVGMGTLGVLVAPLLVVAFSAVLLFEVLKNPVEAAEDIFR